MEIKFGEIPTPSTPETIFPLDPAKIDQYLQIFSASSERMLALVQAARGVAGAETSVYYHIPLAELTEWHKKEKDFSDGDIYYKMGVLYGHDVSQYVIRRGANGSDLLFDNDEAFARALQYTKDTYRGLDDTETGWRRQKLRELRYTGSDVLSIAAATQDDYLRSRLPANIEKPKVDDTLAFYVGLVDGAVLTDSYNAFRHDRQPRIFDEGDQHSYAPLFGPRHKLVYPTDGFGEFQLESDEFLECTKGERLVEASTMGIHRLTIPQSAMIYSRNVMVQTAPNSFRTVTEAEAVLHIRYGLGATSVRAVLTAGTYVFGDVLCVSFGQYVPIAALTTLGVFGASYGHNIYKANKLAQACNVPFGCVPHREYQELQQSAATPEQTLLHEKVAALKSEAF